MKFSVRVTPNASQDKLVFQEADVLHVRIRASAHDGKANEALIALLAKHFRVAKSCVRISRGAHQKYKILDITVPEPRPRPRDATGDISQRA